VREDARACGSIQLRRGPPVTNMAELALKRFRPVAQERFDHLMSVAPPFIIQRRGFRNDGE
jgi:hypothetical protein